MNKRAIILAGGKGTRLRPYTVVLPKPLVPVGDYPVLEIIIRQLSYHGFDHITLTVNHQAEIIKAFFGNGSKWNIKIDYSFEDKPLSTMGPLKLIPDLPDDFLIMNGDVLTDLDFSKFYNYHKENNRIFSISGYNRTEISEYGVLKLNESSLLNGFIEKPRYDYTVSMGIYMAKKEILNYIPSDVPFGFDNLMLYLISKQKEVIVHKHDGYWLDIGRPDDYAQAVEDIENMKEKLMPWE
jgi:NDP-sugar pyrophosphorylase family protein